MRESELLKLVDEYQQLVEKIKRLNKYLDGKGQTEIAYYEYELLEVQRGAMQQYARALRMRIEQNRRNQIIKKQALNSDFGGKRE